MLMMLESAVHRLQRGRDQHGHALLSHMQEHRLHAPGSDQEFCEQSSCKRHSTCSSLPERMRSFSRSFSSSASSFCSQQAGPNTTAARTGTAYRTCNNHNAVHAA